MVKTKLNIIIPAYNAQPYLNELIERLKPQIVPGVQVIIVDDGSRENVQRVDHDGFMLIRQQNYGAASNMLYALRPLTTNSRILTYAYGTAFTSVA